MTLAADAFDIIDLEKVNGLIMIAPKASLSRIERKRLVEFVSRGGRLLYASGYYESLLHKQWLDAFGCKISPRILGANQDIPECSPGYSVPPKKVESWALELKGDWDIIARSYDIPFIAKKKFGDGAICIFSDSYAMLNGRLCNGPNISHSAYNFYTKLFKDVFFNPVINE